MANQWLRLWHELPNDPKWRTIARASGEPIPSVIAVYLHLIVSASMNVTRGTINVIPEDIASALDIGTDSVTHIMDAMQDRVLDVDRITGWKNRQPEREDNSTGRTKNWRLRHNESQPSQNASSASVTQCDDYSPFDQ
jgi:hypothetical protein